MDAAVKLLNGALSGDVLATKILSTSVNQLRQTGMTRRQLQVLSMFNEGKSCGEICAVMRIEPSTLRDYKAAICKHYGTRPIAKALEDARRRGDVQMMDTST